MTDRSAKTASSGSTPAPPPTAEDEFFDLLDQLTDQLDPIAGGEQQ